LPFDAAGNGRQRAAVAHEALFDYSGYTSELCLI